MAGQSSFSFGSKRFSSDVGSSASSRPGRGQPSLSFRVFVVDVRSGYVFVFVWFVCLFVWGLLFIFIYISCPMEQRVF